jgi:hypothetical protein
MLTAKSEESGEQYLLICVYILGVKANKSYFPEPTMGSEKIRRKPKRKKEKVITNGEIYVIYR